MDTTHISLPPLEAWVATIFRRAGLADDTALPAAAAPTHERVVEVVRRVERGQASPRPELLFDVQTLLSDKLKAHGATVIVQRAVLHDQRDGRFVSDVLVRVNRVRRR